MLLWVITVAQIRNDHIYLESYDVTPDISSNEGESTQIPSFILKPILVYDGECNFCIFWVNMWQRHTSDKVKFVPYQHLPDIYFGVTRQEFRKSVYLITQYRRLRGAAAVFEVLAIGGNDFWNDIYYNVVLADVFFEAGYRLVANNRKFFFWLTKLFYKDARHFNQKQSHTSNRR